MNDTPSRRDVLKGAAATASMLALESVPLLAQAGSRQSPTDGDIVDLTSTSGVFVPPRGRSFFKFSFDFPEPSVACGGLLLSFRVFTFENTYALDRSLMTVTETGDGLRLRCTGLVWAGGQQKAQGQVDATIRRNGSFVEWDVTAEMGRPIKSVAAIVRGVPRGRIALGSGAFINRKEDEVLLGYPFGAGAHHVAETVETPLAVVQAGERDFFFLSSLLKEVRASRFYFQPGPDGYRVELVHELPGWIKSTRVQGVRWRAGRTRSSDEAFRPHFEHLERAFRIPAWERRQDVPAWFRDVSLVVAIHGMHWTGYVFNDFAKALRTLDWVAAQIPARHVMVFLPAWDGRYYWEYPVYQPDARLGGEQGFRRLIEQARRMGFHTVPMFGMNAANRELSVFRQFANATTRQIDGDTFGLDWVDWDNDRHNEGWGEYMNLGVESWRTWLQTKIADVLRRFGADGYFLDISGGWVNNTQADMHEGTRLLVEALRREFPGALAVGEFAYDAQMATLPVYHVFPSRGYPAGFQKYARAFQHLSHPAPGRGSSGVHEAGFGFFNPRTLSLNPQQIPTISVVDDTVKKHREEMAAIIKVAQQRAPVEWK